MEEENNELKELWYWDFPNTKEGWNGYDRTSVPVASDANFKVLIDRINELTKEINKLKSKNE